MRAKASIRGLRTDVFTHFYPKDIDKAHVSTANLSIFYLTSKHFNIFLTVIRELMFINRQWATTGGRRRAVQGG